MPELPELEVVCEVLNHRILGQTILTAESIPPGWPGRLHRVVRQQPVKY